MPSYYLDSSALVKRYVDEPGSAHVAAILRGDHAVHAASITEVEVVAGDGRRSKAPDGDTAVFAEAVREVRAQFDSVIQIVDLSPAVLDEAVRLAAKHALRGYDAVQLAAALAVSEELKQIDVETRLISADLELNAAAIAEGLTVENPDLQE
jgi:predicted nucleic acid-binding protein